MTRPLVLHDHNLTAEVYAVLPICEPIEVDLIAYRVYDRFQYAADEEDILPEVLEVPVADRLRRLFAAGRVEKLGGGWRRKGAR